jgi:hypothetical protein
MSTHDDDDLFGDRDSGGSLFGDDNDSVFDYSSDNGEQQPAAACPSVTKEAAEPAEPSEAWLSLPLPLSSDPDPHDALSRSHVGHTSGHHAVSTLNPSGNAQGLSLPEVKHSGATLGAHFFGDQAIDTFAVASHSHGDHEGYVGQGETYDLSLLSIPKDGLTDELERMFHQEFSQGEEGNLGQHIDTHNPPSTPVPHTDPSDELERMMEFEALRDQAVRRVTTARKEPDVTMGIGLNEIDFRWSEAATCRGIRLPHRIDFDDESVDILKPYVTLSKCHPPFFA